MNARRAVIIAVAVAACAVPALAQTTANPLTDSIKAGFDRVKGFITKAADQMPEADYAFKPTPEVRSFGQILGHIADANLAMCSAALGEKRSGESVEKTATTKAELQKALADAFALCDKAFAGTTDATAAQMLGFFGGQQPRLGILAFNTNHNYDHYGNIVTYMRLKGMVPPSSQRPPK